MNRRTAITLLAGTAAVGGSWAFMQPRPGQTDFALPGAANAQEGAATELDTSSIQEMALGEADAPVTMIEYGSFTCPHCAAFHADQYQQLKRDYIDTGKVRFIFREVYFDRFGLWASMVARCGGEMRFFGIHDMIYETQTDWIAGGRDPAAIAENLRKIGIQAGLDAEEVDACLSDGTMAETLVAWFQENAEADEVQATPTLMIQGEKYSNMAYGDLAAVIDEQLEEAGAE
ncbi:DsbA family protein [Pseudoroseicyclus tamaricis]|uniref:DsbA family protein n=1 Tax=Pseudoroseicyclus tamaricis TaxID=2705421 RepID=A0A6B2JXJ8_9RHOB|nr:DsbA family protein [Pseudoroseicyclus tamaricis]NDV02860.1 DsbA family protein [Pseudoroseicyclus tamaricis]